ncbi:hypothetical protein ACH5RR_008485 [Cinchona calisaya]|uniref:Uncharacterized protein n=1 Tax=Cinchona calisaya TaxID=153742 RepID=A0ABD3ADD9_9GENT
MASSSKGKNKNKEEKSKPNNSNANKKQIEISNCNLGLVHGKEGDRCDAKYIDDNEVERQLFFKIEVAFKEGCDTILGLGYYHETTKKSLLSAGFIVGESKNLSSIIKKNSLNLML